MRILGIDPGPDGFAWALMEAGVPRSDHFENWAEHNWNGGKSVLGNPDGRIVAIEDFTAGRILGKSSKQTIETIGMLRHIWPDAILIPRIVVARSLNLAANRKRGDTQINAAMCRLYPELRGRKPGLNSHTRAACAVAHAAIGELQRRSVAAHAAGERG